jgi:peptide/nickel transport system ATP-binding protein
MFLELRDLVVAYPAPRGVVHAVAGIDLEVEAGATVGLVGESGSGKSTVARAIVGLTPVASGTILVDGLDITRRRGRSDAFRRRIQLVFQDPYTSLNPRMTVGETLGEALSRAPGARRFVRGKEVAELLGLVGLAQSDETRYPSQFSGGQRQRIAIARALAVRPELIIADEITSSLDVSTQAAILNLLKDLQTLRGVSYLFISHNLGLIRWMSQEVAVMHLGKIVERGVATEVFDRPRHPYTRALIDAIPRLEAPKQRAFHLEGEIPDPRHPPPGCRFHLRCPIGPTVNEGRAICATDEPGRLAYVNPNRAACHFPLERVAS